MRERERSGSGAETGAGVGGIPPTLLIRRVRLRGWMVRRAVMRVVGSGSVASATRILVWIVGLMVRISSALDWSLEALRPMRMTLKPRAASSCENCR